MTLIYILGWHLIPRWPLRCIFARFTEQLLKDLVSWGSPFVYSMIYRFLGNAFAVLSCPEYHSSVWCSATDAHLKLLDRLVSGACFLTGVCFSVILHISDLWQYYVCCLRSDVTWSNIFMKLYIYALCVSAVTRDALDAHRYTYASPGCRTSQCHCGTILDLMVWTGGFQ